ncbi:MAG: ATP-binding protein [Rhodobacteraceae bacterium]|nr:ATP-binding protein [Paracoccaceae bacterium]
MDRIETLTAVIGALSLPALVIGRGKRLLAMNEPACVLLGHNATGSHYTTVLRQPAPIEAIEDVLAGNDRRTAEHLGQEGDRDLRYRLEVAPVGASSALGALVTFQDLSDAEGLGQMRRDFVANVSHELRTPLTALMGFIETLRGPATNDHKAAARFLSMMETEAERMNRLVADLLSLSRLESEGRLKPDAREDIVAIVKEAVETLPPQAGDIRAEISLALPEDEVFVRGDRDQLMQVLRNLLENAVKYGGGETRVALTLVDREPILRGPGVIIDVTDNGDGIDPHHLPRLTERFYRVDAHRSRERGGTGLGLAIVKHIVSRHRGRLRIRSLPGEGSTFSVVLPRL